MKLKLIALAVAAIASAAASAQTANVTLYGVVDTYIANVRASSGRTAANAVVASASTNQMDAGGLSGSRFGFRGSEALGGGLNAVFTLEAGVNSDVGSSAQGGLLFGRQAFVGLNGGFGSVTAGRQYSPIFYVFADSDSDGLSNFSPVTHQMLSNNGAQSASQNRVNNALVYASPNMGGFGVRGMWGFGESPAGTSAGRVLGFNATYANGPIFAGVGYSDQKSATGASVSRGLAAGGSFDAGVAKISADYYAWKNPSSDAKVKSFVVGANVPLGAASLVAQVGQFKNSGAANSFKGKQSVFNLGANYAFSKRTDAYFRYVSANNNAAGNLDYIGVGGPAIAATTFGADKRAIAVGMRHRF
jgi:predicted porin